MKKQIEKQLISRLKFIAYILLLCAIFAFNYEWIANTISEKFFFVEEEIILEFEEIAPLNTTAVSVTFALVAVLCFFVSSSAKKKLAKATIKDDVVD